MKKPTVDNECVSLYDRLALFFHSIGHGSIESDIEELTNTLPDAIRVIADYIEETESYAVNTVSNLRETANSLEGLELQNTEGYWEMRKRLKID